MRSAVRAGVPLFSLLLLLLPLLACSAKAPSVTSATDASTAADAAAVDAATFVPHPPSSHAPASCASNGDAAPEPCTQSSDCPSGQGCMCGSLLPGNALNKPNECVPAQCRQDSDCGPGGYCSPSIVPLCGATGTTGFYCHTTKDTCDDDTDCATTYGPAKCTWTGSSWGCVNPGCAG